MTLAPAAIFKIPTESPQPARKAARPARRAKAARPAPGRVLANGTGRTAIRGGGEVIELDYGITVYPAREEKGRWRAVWYEDGKRQQCEAGTEQKLAAKLEKVTERALRVRSRSFFGISVSSRRRPPHARPRQTPEHAISHGELQARSPRRLLLKRPYADVGGAGSDRLALQPLPKLHPAVKRSPEVTDLRPGAGRPAE